MKKFYPEYNRRAFTLIELMIGVTIFIIAVIVLLAVTTTMTKSRSQVNSISNVQGSSKLAMEMMASLIKNASSISGVSGTPTNTLTITSGTKNYSFTRSVDAATNRGYVTMTVTGIAAQRLTSPDVNVTDLSFRGSSTSDPNQKNYVTISMQVQSAW